MSEKILIIDVDLHCLVAQVIDEIYPSWTLLFPLSVIEPIQSGRE